ncbi:Na+/H+ antiporter subunit E [Nitrosovibrio sp. Nv6]|uniref:Na+/H+ antiporter subunit E n=1 Tax=Nitrosovibrio sp. Nv6 TaxID=1855340 RepID=UPI0008AD0807|nr:Na+/H+ antiporter subunit E [Nitrosovibrio sp. Nv6]SEO60874.1 multicomponent K+:H+ antiporter subunit E [Nitrosovibrio sp. Nv6]
MKRWPSLTLFTVTLFALWLLLNDTLAPGQLALGLILTIAITLGTAVMRPLRARPHHLLAAVRLFFVVLLDIARSNIAVAGVILGPAERRTNSGFMKIPIDLRDPYGLATLACIITATPGTVWAGLSPDGAALTIHVLDLQDEEAWVRTIKYRYERPLMEIFE